MSAGTGLAAAVPGARRDGIEVWAVAPGEFEGWVAATDAGFGRESWESGVERLRALVELDRTVAAFEGREIVGTANAFSRELTVPGGSLPTAALAAVSVLPTHR